MVIPFQKNQNRLFGDPLETIWKNCIFDLCGVQDFNRKMFNIVVVSSENERQLWLTEVRQLVMEKFCENI